MIMSNRNESDCCRSGGSRLLKRIFRGQTEHFYYLYDLWYTHSHTTLFFIFIFHFLLAYHRCFTSYCLCENIWSHPFDIFIYIFAPKQHEAGLLGLSTSFIAICDILCLFHSFVISIYNRGGLLYNLIFAYEGHNSWLLVGLLWPHRLQFC